MRPLLRRLLSALAPKLAYGYLKCVAWTTSIRWLDVETVAALEAEGKNFLYAFWHGRQVFFTISHRKQRAAIMVSQSRDGDIIAEVMRLSGLRAVRGSSSRGGAGALKEMMRCIRSGLHLGISPDGPRGPLKQVQPGALYLAQRLHIPIVPISNGLKRSLVVGTWDEFHIPLPFNRAAIAHGKPIYVAPSDSIEEKSKELQASLNEADRRADAAAKTP
ncbi:MAG: hypothetical protein A3G41_09085 [Elusimicrobia bacterium RIFCSPLOWO2_12_FULL_59_9]|nr:MAG: hypothetical protein A3G41_09085 [Elusimicrobia bacterium RIFCSPLOWO2_12_FULL_59_9]